ncbi:MBL fold metallo-hydrolase [Helicobacter suis]|uniref:Cytidine monophosphate-N-acetylneuraminic acid hydroxylase n=1 Tax=Helicobacter suis HS5 TaxID=710394 RepID=E7G3M6_9HELI|nr:MBL fold metallo-hydrolase [Helicobacter suis]EFX42026.1 cytidine monophosphate-N-acetylneuraminic acid hydroxylase [Helicobacter suis HS5]
MAISPTKKNESAPVKMRRVGLFEISENTQIVPARGLLAGVNDIGQFIVNMKKNVQLGEKPEVEWIIDQICNHCGGKLQHKQGLSTCPYCNWALHIESLTYLNGVAKKPLRYQIEGRALRVQTSIDMRNPYQSSFKGDFKIRYFNHACLLIEAGGAKLITDPWLVGPSFLGSGYLEKPSCREAVRALMEADFIFISSNRSSCLHPQTLSLLPKDKPFIVGNFASKSVEKSLRSLGFINIYPLEFQEIYEFSAFFQFSVFAAGDGLEDSGLYVCLSGHDVIINAYGNYLNTFNLPSDLTLLCLPFSGGTSGFPFCMQTEKATQTTLHNQRLEGFKYQLETLLTLSKPAYVMPIATPYFQDSPRDSAIKELNTKNPFKEGKQICDIYSRSHSEQAVKWLNPDETLTLEFKTADLVQWREDIHLLRKEKPQEFVDFYTRQFNYDPKQLITHLQGAKYKAKEIVTFVPTSEDFERVVAPIVQANFETQEFKIIPVRLIIKELKGHRVLILRVRREILACVMANHLPFEEMVRGFHCRIERSPDAYEANFWHHFSHVYIAPQPYSISLKAK